MKSYYAPQQFCFVGKAWEVQHYLRKLVAEHHKPDENLVSLLKQRGIPAALDKSKLFKLVSSRVE